MNQQEKLKRLQNLQSWREFYYVNKQFNALNKCKEEINEFKKEHGFK